VRGLRRAVAVRGAPEALEAEYAINEGAGDRLVAGDRVLFVCATAEKATAPFVLRVRGRTGHAALPGIADKALVHAAALIERLGSVSDGGRVVPEVERLLRAAFGDVPGADEVRARASELGPRAVELIEPLLGMTVSPTMIRASEKRNVIPGICEVTVDCRLLPGQRREEAERAVRSALGDGPYELEWRAVSGGTRSPVESPLWRAVQGFVDELEPGAELVPICLAGFTDSHWLRERYGTVAYGFFPQLAMPADEVARLVHSADERIPVDDLELGVRFLRHVAQAVGRS
jgi:acetylornithine deacetylase/succinyl-diaminopimelate desuccinylase-like protein